MSDPEFRRGFIRQGLILGVASGWFESFDEETLDPIPFPKIFKKSDYNDKATMAHIMREAGIFTSIGEARRAGWDKPIVVGDYIIGKKKIRVRIVE